MKYTSAIAFGVSGMCGHGHLALGAFRTCHAGVRMDRRLGGANWAPQQLSRTRSEVQ